MRREGRQDAQIEALRVVLRQIRLHLLDDLGVVRALLVEPEDRGRVAETCAADRELYPVLHRSVFRLTGAPDVTVVDRVLDQNLS